MNYIDFPSLLSFSIWRSELNADMIDWTVPLQISFAQESKKLGKHRTNTLNNTDAVTIFLRHV